MLAATFTGTYQNGNGSRAGVVTRCYKSLSWTSLQAIAEVRFDVVSHFQKEVKTLREEFGRSRSDEVWSR